MLWVGAIRELCYFSDMSEPLSIVLITHNAAHQLVPCLQSVAGLSDDIVVVDSGSTDSTVALALTYGARVIETDWPGFGVQKQRAVAAARHDWVLCLDADERLTPALGSSIRAALASPAVWAYRFARCNRFMGRYLRYGEGYPDWSLRLFHRDHARWSDDSVHEKVLFQGTIATLRGDLLHDTDVSLADYLAKQNRYTSLQAAALQARGKRGRWAPLVFSPLLRFIKFYLLRQGFRDGIPGLVHISIGCMNSFLKYAKLLELTRKP